jgi:hypothetical protein
MLCTTGLVNDSESASMRRFKSAMGGLEGFQLDTKQYLTAGEVRRYGHSVDTAMMVHTESLACEDRIRMFESSHSSTLKNPEHERQSFSARIRQAQCVTPTS